MMKRVSSLLIGIHFMEEFVYDYSVKQLAIVFNIDAELKIDLLMIVPTPIWAST